MMQCTHVRRSCRSCFALILVLLILFLTFPSAAQVHVRGYFRKDGTYVSPHYRSLPDGDFYNNWSTKGNINPYTGKEGTRVTPPNSSGSSLPSNLHLSPSPTQRSSKSTHTEESIHPEYSNEMHPSVKVSGASGRYSHEAVVVFRCFLKASGFGIDDNTDRWSEDLVSAVRAFQAKENLTADGVIGPRTLEAMAKSAEGNINLGTETRTAFVEYFSICAKSTGADSGVGSSSNAASGRAKPSAEAQLSLGSTLGQTQVESAELYSDAGDVFFSLELFQDAIEAYQQAIRLNPNLVDAQNNLGVSYSIMGRHEDAIAACKRAVGIGSDRNPECATGYANLGAAYAEAGRHEDAIEAYKQAISINPDDTMAYQGLGLTYVALKRYQDSIEAAKQALRVKPDSSAAYNTLGIGYGMLGRYGDAIEAFKYIIRVEPDNPTAHYNIGVMYAKNGDRDSALSEYKILKNLDEERANKLFSRIYK